MTKYILSSVFVLFYVILHAQPVNDSKLASEYFNKGEFDKAVGLYEKLHEKDASNENDYKNLLKCYSELKEDKKAEKTIRKQIKMFPADAQYIVGLGVFYKSRGMEKEAKKEFESAIKQMPGMPDKIIKTATAFMAAKETDYAVSAYKEGEKYLGRTYFSFELAELYFQKNDYAKAVEEYIALLNTNPTTLSAVQIALTGVLDENPESLINTTIKNALLKEIQKNSSSTVFADLLMWYFVQIKSFEVAFTQAKALDKRLKEKGDRVYDLAKICLENENFDLAERCFKYVIEKGPESPLYIQAKVDLVKATRIRFAKKYSIDPSEKLNLESLYQTTLAELRQYEETAPLQIEYANFEAFYMNKPETAQKILEELIERPRIQSKDRANAKLELADVLLLQGDLWEPALLYGQVDKEFKNDLPGQEAKFRNARLAYFRGEFEYAQSLMKVLKASTSKLIANDALSLSLLIIDNLGLDSVRAPLEFFSRADLSAYRLQYSQALATLDSCRNKFPDHSLGDEILYKEAQIYLKMGNTDLAAKRLEDLIKKFPSEITADDAVFQLAELEQNVFENKEKAMKYYEDILLNYKGSVFTAEARKRFRLLRGDKLN